MFVSYSSTCALNKVSLYTTQNYIVLNPIIFVHCKKYNIDKTLRFMLFELTIFKELINALLLLLECTYPHNPLITREFSAFRGILTC